MFTVRIKIRARMMHTFYKLVPRETQGSREAQFHLDHKDQDGARE